MDASTDVSTVHIDVQSDDSDQRPENGLRLEINTQASRTMETRQRLSDEVTDSYTLQEHANQSSGDVKLIDHLWVRCRDVGHR